MDIFRVVLQSFVALVVLFVLSRITGKRAIHQLNAFDYVNSITIGSIAAELATDLEHWTLPLAAMLVFGLATAIINWSTCKSLLLRKCINGKPLVLYENDRIEKENLLKAKLDINEFLTQCRIAGYFDLFQIKTAIMETNGQISFLPKEMQRPVTPQDFSLHPQAEGPFVGLIFDGEVLTKNLAGTGRDLQWLRAQLHSAGIGQVSEVFFACCDQNGNFRACRVPPQGSNPSDFGM